MSLMAYARLLRVWNAGIAVIGVFAGTLVARGPGSLADYLPEIALAMLTVTFVMFAGNALNDYLDREVDKRNNKKKPLITGEIKPATAKNLAIGFFALALIASIFINSLAFVIAWLAILLMVLYEAGLKETGLAGNLTISGLIALIFIFSGAAVSEASNTILFALMAFLAMLAREIIKDIEDMRGDAGSRSTLPMKVGKARAWGLAFTALLLAIVISPAPWIAGMVDYPAPYLAFVCAADAIFIYSGFISQKRPGMGQSMIKFGALFGLLAFVLGKALPI